MIAQRKKKQRILIALIVCFAGSYVVLSNSRNRPEPPEPVVEAPKKDAGPVLPKREQFDEPTIGKKDDTPESRASTTGR